MPYLYGKDLIDILKKKHEADTYSEMVGAYFVIVIVDQFIGTSPTLYAKWDFTGFIHRGM